MQTEKQNTLTAGQNITIENNVISATGGGSSIDSQTITTLQQSVSSLEQDIDEMENDIEDINSDITTLQTSCNNLENEVDTIENDIDTLENNVDTLENTSENLDTRLTTLEDTVENLDVGGGTGGSGGSCDCEQDILTLQSDVANLQQQINCLASPYDPYYVGQSYSDYPAGTIFQSYDYYERNFNLTSTGTIDFPTIIFCAEPGSEGCIKINLDFTVRLKTENVLIQITLNDNIISQETFIVSEIDTINHYSKTLYENLNLSDRGNKLKVSLTLYGTASNTRNINANYLKAEFTAPNAEVISKFCPYEAININGTYYFSDTTTDKLKTAQINSNDIININSLNWTNTNIDAQESKHFFCYKVYDTQYVVEDIGYATMKNDLTLSMYIPSLSYNKIYNTSTYKELTWVNQLNNRAKILGITENNRAYALSLYPYATELTDSGYYNFNGVSFDNAKLITTYNSPKYYPELNCMVDYNGNVLLRNTYTNGAKSFSLGYGTNPTIYFNTITSSTNYTGECYLKRFDKIIRYSFSYNRTTFTITDITEMGHYEKYFKLSETDYAVIKNGSLLFFRR